MTLHLAWVLVTLTDHQQPHLTSLAYVQARGVVRNEQFFPLSEVKMYGPKYFVLSSEVSLLRSVL